jgi:hypothetical protein
MSSTSDGFWVLVYSVLVTPVRAVVGLRSGVNWSRAVLGEPLAGRKARQIENMPGYRIPLRNRR